MNTNTKLVIAGIVLVLITGYAVRQSKNNLGSGIVENVNTYSINQATSTQLVVGRNHTNSTTIASTANGARELRICQSGGSAEVAICFNATTCGSSTAATILASSTNNTCLDVSAYQGPILAAVNSTSASSTVNVGGSNNGK